MLTHRLLAQTKRLADKTDKTVFETLRAHAGLNEESLAKGLATIWQFQYLDMNTLHALAVQLDDIPYVEAIKKPCVVLKFDDDRYLVVIDDPFNADLQEWITARVTHDFEFAIASTSNILALLKKHEENMFAMQEMVSDGELQINPDDTITDLSLVSIDADQSQVVKLVNSTLYDALKAHASDIHLEVDGRGLVIKYRLDGVLEVIANLDGVALAEQVISRIKIMSELDIAERRVPQDGRFKVSIQNREVDFRVSIMPSVFGEDAVLRVLDRSTITSQVKQLSLEQLGFDPQTIHAIRKMVLEPYGMVLVTGPTGSGKTTTLYAGISETNNGKDKIITIEDPVEYQLPGVLQIPVNEKKGLTFAKGLRSILRHDPDKIMVGEIRDADTAQIAIQSALTGHLVFTTVHANNVFDVLSRFTHMGVDAYSFVSALNGIVSQRLVRLICSHCKIDDHPSEQLLKDSGIPANKVQDYAFKIGAGCGECRGTGYKGRRAIAEILDLNDEIREAIIKKSAMKTIKSLATKNGTRYLREVALTLVASGETSLEEINRVTFVD